VEFTRIPQAKDSFVTCQKAVKQAQNCAYPAFQDFGTIDRSSLRNIMRLRGLQAASERATCVLNWHGRCASELQE
jgi:hypothetical protein